jgi:hypothetical protein
MAKTKNIEVELTGIKLKEKTHQTNTTT